MATNKSQGNGTVIQYDAGASHASGDVVLIGSGGLAGVAVHNLVSGTAGSVEVPPGVIYNLAVKGHDGTSNAAIAVGAKLYHAAANSGFELNVKTTDTPFGYALAAVSSGATTIIPVYVAAL